MRVFLSFLGLILAGLAPAGAFLGGDGDGDRSPVVGPNGNDIGPMIDPSG